MTTEVAVSRVRQVAVDESQWSSRFVRRFKWRRLMLSYAFEEINSVHLKAIERVAVLPSKVI